MKKTTVFILFLYLSYNCFSQSFIDFSKEDSLRRDIKAQIEDAVKSGRQEDISPFWLSEEFEEKSKLLENELAKTILIRKVELTIESIDNTFHYTIDDNNVFVFRDRVDISRPRVFRFYYCAERDNTGQFNLWEGYRIDNPLLSLFATEIEQKDLECAYVIQLFPNINYWKGLTGNIISRYSMDTFFYKEKNKKGYFVDEGMVPFDSLEELLIHKFGSIESYIRVYKMKQEWYKKECERIQQIIDAKGGSFPYFIRSYILP